MSDKGSPSSSWGMEGPGVKLPGLIPLTVRVPVPTAVYGAWTEAERLLISREAERAVRRVVERWLPTAVERVARAEG